MADWDRAKASLFALIRAALPRIDYYAMYRGKVVRWYAAEQTVDIQPSDPRMPTMSHVPFRHGLPGAVVDVNTGTTVLIGWENGDPAMDFACLWSGGESVSSLTLNADQIVLGGSAGAEPAAKGQTLQSYLNGMATLLAAHIHPASSGTTSPSVTLVAPALTPPDILASNVQVK